jgi:hypothetical protein
MISVTLTQWCEEEHLELPSSLMECPSNPLAPVFAIEDIRGDFTDMSFPASTSPDVIIGHTRIDAAKIYSSIAHMVCYIDREGTKIIYPQCEACGLPGQSSDKCFPMINFCIVQNVGAHDRW